MKERIERIKEHLAENKKTYIACGLTAVGTGIVFLAASRTNGHMKHVGGDVFEFLKTA